MVGKRLAVLRAARNLSQADVARAVNLTQQAIDNYERGVREPKGAILKKLADFFRVSTDYLLGHTPGEPDALPLIRTSKGATVVQSIRMERLPILGHIRAGIPLLSEENIIGEIEVPASISRKADFALEVTGDSMVGAGIQPGDIVFMRQADKRRPMHGDIVAAMIDQGAMTLKRYVRRDGRSWLQAENAAYAPIPVTPGVIIQGVYVARYTEHAGIVEPPVEDMTDDELITKLAERNGLDPDAILHLIEAAKLMRKKT